MTLIRADEVRAAIIAKMKATTSIMSLLSDANEVRESGWKGTTFSYPNYRVRINSILPIEDCYQQLEASIFCYSELDSSQQAEEMAGAIANAFHDQAFTQNSIRFTNIEVNPIPAIEESLLAWRSEAILRSKIN